MTSLRRFVVRPDGCRIAFEVKGPAGAPGMLVTYPWSPGNASYIAEVGGLDLASLSLNIDELVDGLAERARVAVFDYPRGLGGTTGPHPGDLSVATVVGDYLAVADAAGLAKFGLLGYSWSASAAIEVAARSPRCTALVVGGWPPLESPHRELRDACAAIAADSCDRRSRLGGMYAQYYQSVLDDRPAAAPIADIPRVLFYGTDDIEPMAGKSGSVATLVRRNGDSLVAEGWRLVEVPGRDHDGCLAAEVILTIALPFVSELCGGACS